MQEEASDEAVDSRGIPGWEKVDELARALVNLQGLYSQARRIQELYHNLLEVDKKPLVFTPRKHHPSRGSKRGGHVSVECMKRYAYN